MDGTCHQEYGGGCSQVLCDEEIKNCGGTTNGGVCLCKKLYVLELCTLMERFGKMEVKIY